MKVSLSIFPFMSAQNFQDAETDASQRIRDLRLIRFHGNLIFRLCIGTCAIKSQVIFSQFFSVATRSR